MFKLLLFDPLRHIAIAASGFLFCLTQLFFLFAAFSYALLEYLAAAFPLLLKIAVIAL